jgi:UDP-galactopyranose mutase
MILITGAGLSGAVLARKYAEAGKKVLVVEKRNHIGGNCYDYINRDGILVPKYGPHFFHTNMDTVIEFVSRFSEWILYEHRVLSYVDGKLVPVPVNINTVNTLFDLDIKSEREMIAWLDENTIKTEKPANSEESAISRVGPVLYEKMFKSYTKKQ